MLVTFPDTLSVSEYFELARYGQVILSRGRAAAHVHRATRPTAAGFIDHEIDLARRTSSSTTRTTARTARSTPRTPPTTTRSPASARPTLPRRGHDHQPHRRAPLVVRRAAGTDAWRIRPVTEAYNYAFTAGQRAPGRPRRRRPPEGRQLQRPQLLPDHRHYRATMSRAARRRTWTAAAQTARSSSSASAPRCSPR